MSIGLVTVDAVRDALKALRRNDAIRDNPLLGLEVLRERLDLDGLAISETALQWALGQLMAELVDAALIEARTLPPAVVTSEKEPERQLAADFVGGHEAREAWSALYHHYVAPERYRIQTLTAITGFSASHLWRRRQRGFEMLAEALRSREALAESEARSAAAPAPPAVPPRDVPRAAGSKPEPGPDPEALARRLLAELRGPGEPEVAPSSAGAAWRVVRRPASSLEDHRLARYLRWSPPLEAGEELLAPIGLRARRDAGPEEPGGRWQAEERRFSDLADAMEALDAPALVLLGPPGAGKSTLLGRLERRLARAGLRAGNACAPIPFFVRLGAYRAEPPEGPLPWLERRWRRRAPGCPPLRELLAEGRVVLLLDGLDEMPHREDQDYWRLCRDWQQGIEEIHALSPANRLVFSCRGLDYSAPLSTERLPVPQLRLEALESARAAALLGRWTGLDDARIARSVAALAAPELLRSPFFLRLMAEQLLASEEGLVRGRAQLLTRLVRRALHREVLRYNPRFRPGPLLRPRDLRRVVQAPEPPAAGGEAEGPLFEGLTRLAYGLAGGEDRGEDRGGLWRHRCGREEARGYLGGLDGAALEAGMEEGMEAGLRTGLETGIEAGMDLGLLDEDAEDGAIGFAHPLLQDYFVARRLARRPEPDLAAAPWRAEETIPTLREALARLPPGEALPPLAHGPWEESQLLAAELAPDPEAYVEALATVQLPLAGRAARRLGARLSEASRCALQRALRERLEDPCADLRARIEAAWALAPLGDPRFARCEGPEGDFLAPPLQEVPAGRYPLGDAGLAGSGPAHTVTLPPFRIGRYAVTNAEYACFVESGGYEDTRWWDTPAARAWQLGESTAEGRREAWRMWRRRFQETPELRDEMRADGRLSVGQHEAWGRLVRLDDAAFEALLAERFEDVRRTRPRYWDDPDYNGPGQPVVGVSWFEARAYARWLATQTGQPYRLPSEAEWEVAALRGRAWRFAWGDELDPLRANVLATRLRRPAPVGAFVEGRTPEGLFDITGNTQDWTSSIARPYPYDAEDGREDPTPGDVQRVIRGGAFYGSPETARCAYRFHFDPRFRRLRSTGFRLACAI